LRLNGCDISQANINELGKLPNLTNLKITGYAVNVDFSPVKNVLSDKEISKYPKVCEKGSKKL